MDEVSMRPTYSDDVSFWLDILKARNDLYKHVAGQKAMSKLLAVLQFNDDGSPVTAGDGTFVTELLPSDLAGANAGIDIQEFLGDVYNCLKTFEGVSTPASLRASKASAAAALNKG